MAWIIPLTASIISLLLTWSLVKQYTERKKIHQLLYAISLAMFTVAAFGEFYSEWKGFNSFIYKLYYFPAISLVPIMAAGTLYLLFRKNRWIAHLFLLYTIVLTTWLLVLMIQVVPDPAILGKTIAVGGEGMPDYIRRFSFPLSGVGGIALILGAVISWWKTRYKGNLYIAGGAIVMSFGGRLAAMGLTSWLPLSELLGILLLYYGVIIHPASSKSFKKSM